MTPEMKVRMLRYRLGRQGMLELDAWLASLLHADMGDPATLAALETLLELEPPELEAMMHSKTGVPERLRKYLSAETP